MGGYTRLGSLFVSDNSDGDEHIISVCTVQIPAVEKHVQDCTVHTAQCKEPTKSDLFIDITPSTFSTKNMKLLPTF